MSACQPTVELLIDIRNYKKLDFEELSLEKFERKPYFFKMSLEDIRLTFKIKSKVTPTVRKNFSGKYRKSSLLCPSCRNSDVSSSIQTEDTQEHIMFDCPAFSSLRENQDMSDDEQLKNFFKAVLDYRFNHNQE